MKSSSRYFLQSPRLGFRRWRENDQPLAINLWGDINVTRYFDARGALSTDAVANRLSAEIHSQERYGVQYWPMFLLDGDHHVGCCGLRAYNVEERVFEMGVHICHAYWRRGIAYEAACCVIDYARRQQGINALFAGHNPANVASARLLEKLGFDYTHDEYYEPTGLQHPSYLLSTK